MNKIFNIFAALTCIFAFSACSSNSDSEYKFEEQTYYRIVDNTNIGATPYFSRSSGNFVLNPEDKTIKATTTINLNGNTITVETGNMTYTTLDAYTYKFAGNAKASGHDVTNLSGYYDRATSAVYLEMTIDGKNNVYITSIPLFPYTTTTVTSVDDSTQPLVLDNAMYGLAFDNSLSNGLFAIMNFQISSLASPYNEIDYKGFNVVPTAVGYSVNVEKLTPNISGDIDKYTITNLKIDITRQGRAISGSYTCDGKNVTFTGTTFNIKE
ncbi:MAG: hypothetical protein IIT60_02205 [Muribaculaceae bacterium]|nr:hypothetical protein [Muribaculaceae bacterium]